MLRTIHLALLIIVLLLSFTISGCATYAHSQAGTTTTIVLTRHAERTTTTKVLTEKGRARAQDLVKAAGNLNITAIYSPNLVRNLDTVRPLAKHLGLEITVVDSKPNAEKVVKTMLSNHPGKVVMWVGNTTNLSDIYSLLGGEGDTPDNYGDLCIMKIKDKGRPEVINSSYGAP